MSVCIALRAVLRGARGNCKYYEGQKWAAAAALRSAILRLSYVLCKECVGRSKTWDSTGSCVMKTMTRLSCRRILAMLWILGTPVAAQNPNGFIESEFWACLVPLQGNDCTGGGTVSMLQNWFAPHDVATENPVVGTIWNDIDFGGRGGRSNFDRRPHKLRRRSHPHRHFPRRTARRPVRLARARAGDSVGSSES